MAIATRDVGQPRKKKTPPTFQHLPQNRAIKLKKEWVERQKLKSKWKAQKRKDGLGAQRSPPPHVPDTEQHDNDDEVHPNSAGESSGADDDNGVDGEPERSDVPRKRARAVRSPSPPRTHTKNPSRVFSPPSSEAEDEQKPASAPAESRPSLRELTRQAYSRESLHTFRADPLHRRRGAASGPSSKTSVGTRGARGGGRGSRGSGLERGDRGGPMRGGRGRGRGAGGDGGKAGERRGQPNMKLRMEAMLERIKQGHT